MALMRNNQFIDLEEIVEKPLANFDATAGVHSQLRNGSCGLSVLSLILINETWKFYNDCIAALGACGSNFFTKRDSNAQIANETGGGRVAGRVLDRRFCPGQTIDGSAAGPGCRSPIASPSRSVARPGRYLLARHGHARREA